MHAATSPCCQVRTVLFSSRRLPPVLHRNMYSKSPTCTFRGEWGRSVIPAFHVEPGHGAKVVVAARHAALDQYVMAPFHRYWPELRVVDTSEVGDLAPEECVLVFSPVTWLGPDMAREPYDRPARPANTRAPKLTMPPESWTAYGRPGPRKDRAPRCREHPPHL
jgi:hypothetical protein